MPYNPVYLDPAVTRLMLEQTNGLSNAWVYVRTRKGKAFDLIACKRFPMLKLFCLVD
jgi:hypothetical protein